MSRYYYKNSIPAFLEDDTQRILGELARNHSFALEESQKNSWLFQIACLKKWLLNLSGTILFEYSIPRMGRRIDCVILCEHVVFAIEFKVGSETFESHAIDQVTDYALDLKNFHEQSHLRSIVPILICTKARGCSWHATFDEDGVATPILTNGDSLPEIIAAIVGGNSELLIDPDEWANSIYKPTPTIVEAAQALYRGHSVQEISRSDAGAINLSRTAAAISRIIEDSKRQRTRSICFLTGVPGAGKTLAGLNLANTWHNEDDAEHAVFLSGNGPLVEVLREALARNEVEQGRELGQKFKKSETKSKAKAFIQNIHHFRDDALESESAPIEKVVIFDEAQRAWTRKHTAQFMKSKKGKSDFNQSEPEFLIGVMDRHQDWATIVCLVGGGQEINTGEAGIREWCNALKHSFPTWKIHVSSKLDDYEYTHGQPLFGDEESNRVSANDDLHLSVSVRSFRSEKVASFVKSVLDADALIATNLHREVRTTFPIFVSRDLAAAKGWLRTKARGSERYGLIASSGATRLKPHGINVKADIDPAYWFLNDRDDVRSSYYLEDVATEFDIQGLELDWTCVAWDADLRFDGAKWLFKSFRGTSWQDVKDTDAKLFLKNAYRVLLTRARQGMVIFVPLGDDTDPTRDPSLYDGTYDFFRSVGIEELSAGAAVPSGKAVAAEFVR